MKKVISILGFAFTQDNMKDGKIWLEPISEKNLNLDPVRGETKLFEFLVEQFTVISLNDMILPKISHHLLVSLSNLIDGLTAHKETLIKHIPLAIDCILFINTRILLPHMLTKTELSDPVIRFK